MPILTSCTQHGYQAVTWTEYTPTSFKAVFVHQLHETIFRLICRCVITRLNLTQTFESSSLNWKNCILLGFEVLAEWWKNNLWSLDLKITLKKYHFLPIRANSNTFSRYTLNGSPLSNLTLASDLGVFVDSNSTFQQHIMRGYY